MEKTILQFGAGNIGKSLVGYIFSELGFRIIFAEKRRDIVDLINARGYYDIEYRDRENGTYRVSNIEAIEIDDRDRVIEAIESAGIISTAVGVKNLPEVALLLYEGLNRRKEGTNILICENLKKSANFLKREIKKHGSIDLNKFGFIETSIAKMVPDVPAEIKEKDPLKTWAERYSTVYLNADGIKGEFVESSYLVPVNNFEAYYIRKIYISNMSHTLSSVLGYLGGYNYIADALSNENILKMVKGAVGESEEALKFKYPFLFETEEDRNYSTDFLRRLQNPLLMDTVFRGGRDISRKLAPGERLTGPAVLFYSSFHRVPKYLCRGIASAFFFKASSPDGKPYEGDVKLVERVKREGIESCLKDITGIDEKSELGKYIIEEYREIKRRFDF